MSEPRTYVFMSEYTDDEAGACKLVAVVSKPPQPLQLVNMAHGLMKPKWYFGKDGREVRTAVIRNVKDEVVRSETRWLFLKAKSVEELRQQGCSRMLRATARWEDPVWLGVLKQDPNMYRLAA